MYKCRRQTLARDLLRHSPRVSPDTPPESRQRFPQSRETLDLRLAHPTAGFAPKPSPLKLQQGNSFKGL